MKDTEAAFLAGVLESDGSIYAGVAGGGDLWALRVQPVIGNDGRLIDYVRNLAGGSVRVDMREKKSLKPVYYVTLRKHEMLPYLQAVLPYMVAKRRQVELAMEKLESGALSTRIGECHLLTELRSLNNNGHAVTAEPQLDSRRELFDHLPEGSY